MSLLYEPGYDVDDGNTNNIDGDWKVRNEVRHPDEDPKAIFSLTERTNKFITERVQNKEPFIFNFRIMHLMFKIMQGQKL